MQSVSTAVEQRLRAAFEALGHAATSANGEYDCTADHMSASQFRPWRHDEYLQRLATFKLSTWFGKPPAIAAPICAAHGWRNIAPDQLMCDVCNRTAHVKDSLDDGSALLSSHHDHCPWRRNTCPTVFVHPRPPRGRPGLRAVQDASSAIAIALHASSGSSQSISPTEGASDASAAPAQGRVVHVHVAHAFLNALDSACSTSAAAVSSVAASGGSAARESAAASDVTSLPKALIEAVEAVAGRTAADGQADSAGAGATAGSTARPAPSASDKDLATAAVALAICGWRLQDAPEADGAGAGPDGAGDGLCTASKRRRTGSFTRSPLAASSSVGAGAASSPSAASVKADSIQPAEPCLRCTACGAVQTVRALLDMCSTTAAGAATAGVGAGAASTAAGATATGPATGTGAGGAPPKRRGLLEAARAAMEAASRAAAAVGIHLGVAGSAGAETGSAAGAGGQSSPSPSSASGLGLASPLALSLLKLTNAGAGIDPLQGHRWHCAMVRAEYALPLAMLQRAAGAASSKPSASTTASGPGLSRPLHVAVTESGLRQLHRLDVASAATPASEHASSAGTAAWSQGQRVASALAAVSTATLGVADMKLVASILRSQARQAVSDQAGAGSKRGRDEASPSAGSSSTVPSVAGQASHGLGLTSADLRQLLEGYDDDGEDDIGMGDMQALVRGSGTVAATSGSGAAADGQTGSKAPATARVPGWYVHALAAATALQQE